MPELRSSDAVERPAPSRTPSVLDALASRKWTEQAECAKPPNDKLTWVVEKTGGTEQASTVVKLLQVCQRCPVRRPCLQDALSERAFSIVGVWGGAAGSERTRTRGEVVADLNSAGIVSGRLSDLIGQIDYGSIVGLATGLLSQLLGTCAAESVPP